MTTQQGKNLHKTSDPHTGRSSIWLLIITLFFLLLAWITWCFFNWKIKAVEKYPIAHTVHMSQYPAKASIH